MKSRIRVAVEQADQAEAQIRLAEELGLDLERDPFGQDVCMLTRRSGRLGIAAPEDQFRTELVVEFGAAKLQHRLHAARTQPLARAIGTAMRRVVDATAGFGSDAATLAALGLEVVLVERHASLWALLRDGLARASANPLTRDLAARMRLVHADSATWLLSRPEGERPDAIYLDPMYPEKRKSALAKREMQLLQRLLGNDDGAERLCCVARAVATRRVVVKRPLRAPPLAAGVHHVVKTKLVRFDVYETNT